MKQSVNLKYKELFTKKPRYFILMGGRGGGRSTVASQYAVAKLISPEYFRCAIMRFVLSDIRNSIYQDILDRVEENELRDEIHVRENPSGFSYGKNRIDSMGFRKSSSDQKAKLKSLSNYNCIIIEEADEIPEDDFMQLDDSLRTLKADIIIILMLNPPDKRHWIIRRWFNLIASGVDGFYKAVLKNSITNVIYIFTTYLDNVKNLNESTITNYEAYRYNKPDHYYSMIKGFVSEGKKGRIFKNWMPISDKEFDKLPYNSFYGLDWGFTNDPTAFIEIKEHNNKVYTKELIYEPGLINQDISKRLGELKIGKDSPIYADSAEPKSIEELKRSGWNVIPTEKGQDSIIAGIDMVLDKEVYYTESSVNIAMEDQEYVWALDKNKEPINEPRDEFNHTMDAIRGAIFTRAREEEPEVMHHKEQKGHIRWEDFSG